MKRALSIILLVMMLFTSALAEDDFTLIKDTKNNQVSMKDEYPDNPVIEGVSSTTGLPASGEAYTPILSVLDNAEAAYPHWGVSQADIIFQIPNAGSGATKLLALFADHYPENAGGARSARASMIPIAMAWDAAFAYAGTPGISVKNSSPDEVMNRFGMVKESLVFNTFRGYAHRRDDLKKPHNASVHILEIHEKLLSEGNTFEQRPFLFTDEPRTEGVTADTIKVIHRGDDKKSRSNPASNATFTYDADSAGYIRTNSSGDYSDRDTGETLTFSNVIVLRIKFRWNKNYVYLNDHLVGSGVAEIFQNGKYVRGAWYRASQEDRIVFVGPDGEELAMQRGKSFIVVTNDVTEVSYK